MSKKVIGYLAVAAFFVFSVLTGACYAHRIHMQQEISQKVLRFHVLANSDSSADQELKLKVRDAVGGYMQKKLAGVENLAECEEVVLGSLGEITELAENTIEENGYDYEVTAALTRTGFPIKTYGNYTFPAGEYEALELVIGEGEGHNWWCVLYPNMCFENSMYEVVDEKADIALQQTLTQEEYEEILSSGNYEIRFRYLTFLNKLCDE